ncbi:hypothetical protein PISMIDRAFT_349747 [Pisolithus microcarpus 441]|uniref:Unplaced genomic scaffold scaffold_25, whole genome shotgun sequence n=1 Tax=Pisolithus microcarpus 441 TaxID=765257 RepID=A0A0C9ZH69_9AGAM|nr:hypothetical protein PISMIDRAFT_349747 [Pisolithus microcarpus 441]
MAYIVRRFTMVSVLTDPCDCPISCVWARPWLGAPTIRWFDIFRVEFRGGGWHSRPKLTQWWLQYYHKL